MLPKNLGELSGAEQAKTAAPSEEVSQAPKEKAEESQEPPDAGKGHKPDAGSTRDAASKGLKDLLRRF
jgi:hypothetical protein